MLIVLILELVSSYGNVIFYLDKFQFNFHNFCLDFPKLHYIVWTLVPNCNYNMLCGSCCSLAMKYLVYILMISNLIEIAFLTFVVAFAFYTHQTLSVFLFIASMHSMYMAGYSIYTHFIRYC